MKHTGKPGTGDEQFSRHRSAGAPTHQPAGCPPASATCAGRAARGIASLLPTAARERASSIAQRAGTAIKESGPFAQLGFDPLELWARIRHFYRD